MTTNNKDYLNENLYNYIDELCESSDKYKDLSETVKDRMSDLLESIEDEDCHQILSDIAEIHDFLTKLNSLSLNELTLIKSNGKILIEKYIKHKEKINSLKTKNSVLEEELSNLNDQKEKALLKLDELNDEYYKLYQEKNNLDLQISIQEKEENKKQKLDNELLKDQIKNLNDRIEILNKQITSSKEEINDLSNKNKEIYKINSQMKEELLCKDEILKMSTERYCKLNDENDSIMSMNRGLQKTIEELDNQNKEYQVLIKQLIEKLSKFEKTKGHERKISFNSIITNEEDEKNKNEIMSESGEITGTNRKKRNAIDYTGRGINLNELIIDESEISEQPEKIEKTIQKEPITFEITRESFKQLSKLNASNHQIENSEIYYKARKNNFLYELLFRLLD